MSLKEDLIVREELESEPEETESKASVFARANLPILEEMMKAGLFIGRKSSKTHPRVKPFIFGARNGVEIINLEETLQFLEKAMDFVKTKVSLNKGKVCHTLKTLR